ncbi:hypothetical protein QH494_08845 [Sphingomonas sp. AR_OL41]|uniref:hypothetical protein n=1 Tax=Sphingomonas sp. AR_OL41 TaxID=3042729 RepID=UPI00248082F6|nr:hypothetical protein [Sphingomonas sp. AR_OL41]MDH7972288.1 hypothetical protein [Sphingomonas sp. AR_OL41]
MKILRNVLLLSTSALVLAGCGANDIASPGTGGNISIINNPSPTPTPTPTPTSTLVTAASGCPTIADSQGLSDKGTISGPTGSYRVCALPSRIVRSINLPKLAGLVYQLPGRVDVGYDNGPTPLSAGNTRTVVQPDGTNLTLTADSNVTLTIQPGVIIYANTGVAWLNVNRGNKINAVGTSSAPIIFTSRDNILGLNTDSSSGQWGGVVLSGRAQITDCAAPGATPGTAACERQTEGAVDPALYGGANNLDNSGTLSYVQIRYSGYILSANSELQSLTTEGVGEGTKIDHIQSFNSSDDGAEFFGGHVGMKYYISVGAEDDNLDTDTGVKGNFQYVIVAQRPNSAAAGTDAIIEADSDNGLYTQYPRHNVILSNFTFIDRVANTGSDLASILIRGTADYTLVNGVMVNQVSNPCLRLSQAQTASATQDATIDEVGAPVFKSVVFSGCATQKYIGSNGVTDAQVQAIFGTGTNNNNDAFTSSLISLFVNGANETAVPAFDASTLNGFVFNGITVTPAGFFDKTTYIGAVKDATDTWYKGWTCNSSTADFGTGNTGACTSIPTT